MMRRCCLYSQASAPTNSGSTFCVGVPEKPRVSLWAAVGVTRGKHQSSHGKHQRSDVV